MHEVRVIGELQQIGVDRGDLLAVVVAPDVGVAIAAPNANFFVGTGEEEPGAVVGAVEAALRPRWVMWSNATAIALVEAGVRVATSWDITAAHRLLFGGWRADSARVWAKLHDLSIEALPSTRPPDLFNQETDDGSAEDPVRSDGFLRPEWVNDGWAATRERGGRWGAENSSVDGDWRSGADRGV